MVLKRLPRCCPAILSSLCATIGLVAGAAAAPLTPGNLVIYRVGDGAAGLLNTGAKVFVDEFTPAGTLVQSIEMPSVGAGAKLIASGTSTSEGLLTVSPSGRWVSITGYNALIPTASLSTTTGAAVNRSVGVLDATSGLPNFTLLSDFASGNTPRAAVTDDGNNLWVAGGAGGVRYTTAGSGTSTQLSTTVVNLRQVNMFGGQLMTSTASGTTVRVGDVGVGLPTVAGQVITNLPGYPANTGGPYAFFLVDLDAGTPGNDVIYVADDATGLRKFSLVAGAWVNNGTIGAAADAYRGVTGYVSSGSVQLFATRRGGSAAAGGGEFVALTDASGYNGAFAGTPTLLATAGLNTAFRGVGRIPGGACCVVGGGCTIVHSQLFCNGIFQGQGTTCSPTPCPSIDGACCLPGGGCIITDSNGCELAGGLFQGVGSACIANLCIGACCLDDGTCFNGPLAQCTGTFRGFGTVCANVICPIIVQGGACCLPDGTCVQVPSPTACNGTYQGDGTVCSAVVCPVMGACCTQNQTCVNTSNILCAQNGGTFYPGVPCNQINCDEGACCLPNGNCVITTVPQICVNNGGTFQGFGTVCVPNPCPQPNNGACCKPDGSCSVLTPADCQLTGGVFQGVGSTCVPNPCPVPIACCFPDGTCAIIVPPQQCNGQPIVGGSCVPNPCPQPVTGACCLADGICITVTGGSTSCTGLYLGDGSVCTVNSCKGACCQPDGTCTFVISSNCNGVFQGIGTACVPSPCPQPTACCSTQNIGQCTLRLGPCLTNEIASGTTCTPNPCPQEGACCTQGGVCGLRTQAQCNQLGGVYQGDGTTCLPNPCPGVCCAGSICLNLGPGQCATVPFSAFVFTFQSCPGTMTQPCCRADFNHDGVVSVQDIFDFLAQWFATSPLCDINGNNGTTVQDIFDFLAAWFAGCP